MKLKKMKIQKPRIGVVLFLLLSVLSASGKPISLVGEWQMRVDRRGEGVEQEFFNQRFQGETGSLPGTNQENLKEKTVTAKRRHRGNDIRGFSGSIWYQREIDIEDLSKENILFMERCRWESFVWINGEYVGTRNSLIAPHEYKITAQLKKGKNTITLLFDNTNRKGRGPAPGDLTADEKKTAKLNCGGHQLVHNWNGAIGEIELRVLEKTHIVKADVFSDIHKSEICVKVLIANAEKKAKKIKLTADVDGRSSGFEYKLSGAEQETVEFTMPIKNATLWSEFNPALYTLKLALGDQQWKTTFGMRELKTEGVKMLLNGRRLSLRGTLQCMYYPILGHEPMDVASWKKQIATAQLYGLNYFRFHTSCPPKAAFQAADELGFYLQVELPSRGAREDPATTQYLTDELKRMIYYYGNHPSFMLASMGNEQLGGRDMAEHKERLRKKVHYGQTTDPRHLYSSTTHPWTAGRIDDFFTSAWGMKREVLTGNRWGGGTVKGYPPFNQEGTRYGTAFDYTGRLEGLDRPLITHELGQWSVYGDFREITRYHGAMRAYHYEMIRDELRAKGLGDLATDFTRASGKLTLLLYKEEIEAVLRTPELTGFQMLQLQDYHNSQVGILNAMWESKGLTTPAEFRQFCSDFVPMARMEKLVWENSETLSAAIEISNYTADDFKGEIAWSLRDKAGKMLKAGRLRSVEAPTGNLSGAGQISIPLDGIQKATALQLTISASNGRMNRYNLWVYPKENQIAVPEHVTFITSWDESAELLLENGANVVYAPAAGEISNAVPGTFSSTFWNALVKNRQPSKTMGLLIDDANPALLSFPTEFHSDFQWQDLVNRSFSVDISALPLALRPAVRTVDNFYMNRSLAMIFEFKYKNGSVLVCTADIVNELDARPEARQLRKSLFEYAASPLFNPDVPVDSHTFQVFLGRAEPRETVEHDE